MAGIDKDARKRLDEACKALAGALSRVRKAATAFNELNRLTKDDLRRLEAMRAMLAQVATPPRIEEWPQADLLTLLEPQKEETPVQRHASVAARHEELKAARDPHPTKTLAGELGCSESWIRQMKRKARKSR